MVSVAGWLVGWLKAYKTYPMEKVKNECHECHECQKPLLDLIFG